MSEPTDLPMTSNHWGTLRVETSNGKVTRLVDFEEDPAPSPIGHGFLDVLEGPTRIDAPMIREGWLENGAGQGVAARGLFVSVGMKRKRWLRMNWIGCAVIT